MGIYKRRTEFINKALKLATTDENKRLLQNGFIPATEQLSYEQYMAGQNNEPDTDIDKISNANWFAVNPNKVAGTIIAGTGFLNPVIVKGTLNDALQTINNILNNQTHTVKNTEMKKSKYKVGDFVKYERGDVTKETWYGVVKSIVDLGNEFAYRVNAYYDGMNDSEKTNEKYEAQLTKSRSKDYRDAQELYKNRKNKNSVPAKKYNAGDKVKLIDTAQEPTMKRYNSATIVKYEAFDHSQKKDWIVLLKADQDLGEFTAWESNIELKAEEKTTKDFLKHGVKSGNIIFATVPKHNKPVENTDANRGPEIDVNTPEIATILKNNLLSEPTDIKEKTQTVSQTLLKYNQGITDNEIKAWVFYKRRFGNPMRGWEKYYLSGGSGFSMLLQTTHDTVVKDNTFNDLRTIPANTVIGIKTKFKHEYKDTNYIICKTPQNELIWVNTSHIKETKHVTNENKADVDALVLDGSLIYDGSEYYPYPVYLFGDIYSKLKQLTENKAAIVEAYGEQYYQTQLDKVKGYLPKTKSFRDPIKSNRPNMLCLSEFANDAVQFGVTQLHEESGVKLGYTKRNRFEEVIEKITLFEAFNFWIESAVKDTDLKNTTRADIRKYYFAKSVSWPKENGEDVLSNTQKQELIGNARLAAEELFGEFLATALTFDDSVVLDALWNEKYNAFTSVSQFVDKIPIAFNGSTMFKDGALDVKPAQRQGLAYLQLVGAGTLAYDVGFGKTLTGILNISQLLAQGAVKRPLIVVPKPTYKNWLKELIGYWTDGEKVEFTEFPGSIYHYGAFSGIAGIKINDWYNLSGKHYERLLKAHNNNLNKLVPENSITVVSYKGFEQMGFSHSVSQDMFDSIARVIMQKDAVDERPKSAKKEEKEKVSFYQKIQGWLGLGNKNAIVNVDECGFDHITVDEAHNFKNVFPACGKDPATGRKLFDISASQSVRAVKMFFITQYIQAKHGKAVVDLTATPFTNSPLEIYSMLSFVGLDTLNQYNLYDIKKFFEQFVLQTIEYAIDAKGEIITKPVIKSFRNLKLLQTILFNHFHYKADPKEAGVVRPCKIDLPNKDITTYLDMNERQRVNQMTVKEIAKSVSREDPGAGLRAMALSLDNAFSPFAFDKSTPDSASDFVNQSPKIKYAVECIRTVKLWHEARGEECSGIVLYSNRGLSYFDYIKDYLIHNLGFKNNISYDEEVISEVEIISGGGGEADEDRKELVKDAFNAGVVKIIIGTGTIREGINLQKRGTVLIDLYPEWNPTDIAQLKGRIWRQGNMYGYIRFVMPLVVNSMDNFINQKLDEKGKRIASLWAPIGDLNIVENTSDLDPAEIKYQLVDDVHERFKMKYETIKAEMERQYKILNENKDVITGVEKSVENLKEAEEEIFTSFTEKRTAWEELQAYLKTIPLEKLRKSGESQKTIKDIERVQNSVTELLTEFSKYQSKRMDITLLLTITRMLKNRDYTIFTDYSRTGTDIKEKLSDITSYYTFKIYDRDYDNLVESWAEVRKAEKSVLNAYGKGFMDDISPIVKDINKKIKALEREKEAVESEEYKNKLAKTIELEIEAAKSVRGDLNEQVQRFASLNHTLSYLNDNTDKENCPIPTTECCPTNGINVIHHDKEITTPVHIEMEEKFTPLIPAAKYFVPSNQISVIKKNSEFEDARVRVNNAINNIPVTYGTDNIKLNDKTAYLHYFGGNQDWYIFEKDKGDGSNDFSQYQAYGMANLGGDYELGYISIADILQHKTLELDLYFEPKSWGQIVKSGHGSVSESEKTEMQSQSDETEIREAIEMLTEMLPDLKGKDKKQAKEAIELYRDMLKDMELQMGEQVEQEHKKTFQKLKKGKITVNEAIEETAQEHIDEDPEYYEKLKRIRKKIKH